MSQKLIFTLYNFMQRNTKRRGWLTLAIVLVAVAGFLVYKYAYLVYQDYDYYAFYDDIHALQIANPVYINGVKVGEVSQIKLNGGEKVRVTLSIDKKTRLTKGTTAVLASNNLRGDKMVFLELGNGTNILKHKSMLIGKYDTTVMDMSDQINPIIESTKYILNTADKNFSGFNRKIDSGLVEKTQYDIRRIEQSMNHYREQLTNIEASASKAVDLIKSLKRQTETAHNNRGKLNTTIKTAETSIAQWAEKPVSGYLDTITTTIKNVGQQATAVENSKTGRDALENKKMYNQANEKTVELNSNLQQIKVD